MPDDIASCIRGRSDYNKFTLSKWNSMGKQRCSGFFLTVLAMLSHCLLHCVYHMFGDKFLLLVSILTWQCHCSTWAICNVSAKPVKWRLNLPYILCFDVMAKQNWRLRKWWQKLLELHKSRKQWWQWMCTSGSSIATSEACVSTAKLWIKDAR